MFGWFRGNNKSTAIVDAVLIVAMAIGVWGVCANYDIFNHLSEWIYSTQIWQLDEVMVVFIFLSFALTVFAIRRWREIARLLESRQRDFEKLRAAKDKAEEASRMKSEFLANMSHEIRTPMNGIIGMTDLALDTELTPVQAEYLRMVKDSADSLLHILNDILDFAKIEAKKLELETIDFGLRGVLGDTMKSLSLRAHEKGLELTYRVPASVPDNLIGDPMRLRQIVVNLVGNAIKFTERGEVVVNVEAENEVDGNARLHFSVRDTGIGISAHKREQIFEAFTQADGSSTRRFGGTGLGLAIATQLAGLMEGHLWVESEPGEGSTFHFTARFALHQHPDLPLKNMDLKGLPVLIVDDNTTNCRILQELALGWQMRPTSVENGPAALEALHQALAKNDPFVLVLLDGMMPIMDGFSVAQRIKAAPELNGATIVMLSSANAADDAARCRALGIARYLCKPVSAAELLEAIRFSLRKSSPRSVEAQSPAPASAPPANGTRNILLAEDDVVNQRVAIGMLEKRGYTVMVANDGKEVMQALACERFDLVLMDVQMPEMDGLEATRAIRREEQATGAHLPIVAMTAHAMKGDRERCLEAGMDDYISKPVEPPQLVAILRRLIPIDAQGATNRRFEPKRLHPPPNAAAGAPHEPRESPAAARRGQAIAAIDLEGLRARVEDDLELMEELAQLFLDSSPLLMAELETAVARRDSGALFRVAHAFKGSLKSICAAPCAEAALALETLGRSGELDRAERAMAALRDEYGRLRVALTEAGAEGHPCKR